MRSHSRLTNQQLIAGAHPLSAPPLSREDSSMEIEVDSLLSLAGGRAGNSNGNGSVEASTGNGHGHGIGQSADLDGAEDTQMGESGQARSSAEEGDTIGNEELSAAELQSVRIRSEIKDHILDGRIKLAIDLCNAHFPTVLNADSSTSTAYEKEAEQGRASKQTASQTKGKDVPSAEVRVLPANPTSLYPAHLSLNLQIQAFIESVRAASTASNPSSSTNQSLSAAINAVGPMGGSQYLATSTPGISSAATVLSRSASPAPSSALSNGSATSANGLSGSAHSNGSAAVLNPVLHAALSHAQLLFTNVQKLPGYWRAHH